MSGTGVLYERDCGSCGRIRITDATLTVGSHTFRRELLVDYKIECGPLGRFIERGMLFVGGCVALGVGSWFLVLFVLHAVQAARHDGPGAASSPAGPDVGSSLTAVLTAVLTIVTVAVATMCFLRSKRVGSSYHRLTVRTALGETHSTYFPGPDPELEHWLEWTVANTIGDRAEGSTMPEKRNNRMALTGFVLALVSIFLFPISVIPILGIVFSSIGLGTFSDDSQKNKWMAGVGLGVSIAYTVVALLYHADMLR